MVPLINVVFHHACVSGNIQVVNFFTAKDAGSDVRLHGDLSLSLSNAGALEHSSVNHLKDSSSTDLRDALLGKILVEVKVPWIGDGFEEEDESCLKEDVSNYLFGFVMIDEGDAESLPLAIDSWADLQRDKITAIHMRLNNMSEDDFLESDTENHLSIVQDVISSFIK